MPNAHYNIRISQFADQLIRLLDRLMLQKKKWDM